MKSNLTKNLAEYLRIALRGRKLLPTLSLYLSALIVIVPLSHIISINLSLPQPLAPYLIPSLVLLLIVVEYSYAWPSPHQHDSDSKDRGEFSANNDTLKTKGKVGEEASTFSYTETRTERSQVTSHVAPPESLMMLAESNSMERFASWAFSTMQRLRKAVGIGFIIAAAFSIKTLEPHLWATYTLEQLRDRFNGLVNERATLAFIQAAACFLLALLTPKASISALARRKGVDESDLATAQKACKRIQLFVVAAYLAWSLYYLITGLSMKPKLDLLDRAFLVTFNTLPSVLLFWLYIELAEFTVDESGLSKAEGKTDISEVSGLTSSSNAAFHRVISIGVFALTIIPVWYAFGNKNELVINVFDGIASCLNGVALALVVGRLGSKNIDPGSLTLGLLYFYAVIQPTAASFHDNVAVQLLATTIALPLKVLLWLVFVWAFTTGILSEYVHDIRILLARQHADKDIQQEITD